MKRRSALLLAALLLLSLFAGCGQSTPAAPTAEPAAAPTQAPATKAPEQTQAPGQATAAPTAEPTPEPTPESPYHFASGKFKANASGIATEKYEYDLPLTTTDEVITMWTTCWTPEVLAEGGYGEMEFPREVENRTGVHVEYETLALSARQQNFAVLLASDDLLDIMCGASGFYTGAFRNAVLEDGYFVNIYDYREYMPNYMYEATKNPKDLDTLRRVFPESDLVLAVYELRDALELTAGAFARGDWLAHMGKTYEDIVTFDDLHDMLYFFMSQEGATDAMIFLSTLDPGTEFVGYDTYFRCSGINTQYVKDGKVYLSNMEENDREIMTMCNQWYNEGLISKNWASFTSTVDYDPLMNDGSMGYVTNSWPTAISQHNAVIPEGEPVGWVPLTKPLRYEGQTLHLGYKVSRVHMGNASISAKCENIPLACTWLDYRYSADGSFLYGYGVQGVSWDYNDKGEIVISDFIVYHEVHWSMVMCIYALNSLSEPGLYVDSQWNVPGNEGAHDYVVYWGSTPHDDDYVYPSGLTYTDEQNDTLARYGSDVQTYLQENYLAFLDNSKPLSEWDSYVAGLHDIGVDEVLAVYQEAYNDYLAG